MKCFVIMPFGDPRKNRDEYETFTNIFNQWIKPTVEEIICDNITIECYRADNVYKPGEIIAHIIDSLVSSEIVIADLSNQNPNVFYELGVRHSNSNNTIIISNNLDDIPFDLRSLRTIPYEYKPDKMLKLKDELIKTIKSIIENPNDIDNPVERYFFENSAKKEIGTSATNSGLIKDLTSELDKLRNSVEIYADEMRDMIDYVKTLKSDINKEN